MQNMGVGKKSDLAGFLNKTKEAQTVRLSMTFSSILAFLVLFGCATSPKNAFVSISDGLPTTGQWKCTPVFGDVNGDGLLDLTAIVRKGNGARVWLNQGDGTWKDASEGLSIPFSCGGGIDLGDINHDGYVDLVVGDHCKGLFVYAGNGKGQWKLMENDLPPMKTNDLQLADFNLDGNLDICACSATDEGVHVFLGDGNGGWQKAPNTGLPTTDSCNQLALGDFNNDGLPDISATMIANNPRVWINGGEGPWQDRSEGLPNPPIGGQYWGVAVADVNGDGNLDLALSRIDQGPGVYLGDGKAGTWQPALTGLSDVQSGMGVAFKDLNGDGHTDLLVSGKKSLEDYQSGYGVFLFHGDGAGHWTLAADTGFPEKGLNLTWGIASADTDGDGTPEVAACFGIPHSSRQELMDRLPADLQPMITEQDFRLPTTDTKGGPSDGILVWTLQRRQ